MKKMLVKTETRPVATVPPRLERHKQHLSGHCGHLVVPLEVEDLDEPPQHMAKTEGEFLQKKSLPLFLSGHATL